MPILLHIDLCVHSWDLLLCNKPLLNFVIILPMILVFEPSLFRDSGVAGVKGSWGWRHRNASPFQCLIRGLGSWGWLQWSWAGQESLSMQLPPWLAWLPYAWGPSRVGLIRCWLPLTWVFQRTPEEALRFLITWSQESQKVVAAASWWVTEIVGASPAGCKRIGNRLHLSRQGPQLQGEGVEGNCQLLDELTDIRPPQKQLVPILAY